MLKLNIQECKWMIQSIEHHNTELKNCGEEHPILDLRIENNLDLISKLQNEIERQIAKGKR